MCLCKTASESQGEDKDKTLKSTEHSADTHTGRERPDSVASGFLFMFAAHADSETAWFFSLH